MPDPRPTLSIDVVSDVNCPWCFLGKRRLGIAVSKVPDINVMVAWRPFRLDPDIPAGGIDRKEYFKAKFGDLSRVESIHAHLAELGAAVGIPYAFDRIRTSVNSLDAHRVVRWAQESGRQDRVLERLFAAQWVEGRDISNHDELKAIATEAGLDGEAIHARLRTETDVEAVKADIEHAARMGVSGVPTFIIARKYAISGAQEADMLANAIREIAREVAAE